MPMTPLSTNDQEFISQATTVLEQLGEIFCVIRFNASAGNRSYEFFRSVESFRDLLSKLPEKSSVIVFKRPQLPIRGVVNDNFIENAIQSLPAATECTIVRTSRITMGSRSWYHNIELNNLVEIEQELRDSFCWGHPVAVGIEPDWHDLEQTIEGVVPNGSGVVQRGIY